ncbi:ParB/RepB/Spo0J family partition protein [Streptomyces hyaluromycini]|uniref:ParB/RepB/Spo0J family partition protein n=1 Tax=Streptomyces hyaluromycini TaxID=1377993 RepID=UPI000B5CD656|nr:ParB/RepB/Spo0J family partition protein [Streptomyces hyaluromycini]
MSKADQLGAGRFGGGVRGVSARRQAVAAATGVPTDGIAPPTELPPHRISLNPDNPRSSLGDLTDLAGSLKTHGQKVAITVMNRDAYLTANPEREADLEADTTHVVIDGSSRLAAAREAQLASIKIMVSDDQGNTSEELLESALVANIHRQDLEELDEARALDRLLKIYGSQTELAKRLHRSQGWVSQRLALLNLTPELQAQIGQEPIKLLRAVGNKPAAEQETALKELKDEQARQEAEKQQRRQKKPAKIATPASQDSEKPGSHYRVIEDDATNASPSTAPAAHDNGEDGARPSAGDDLDSAAPDKDEPHQEDGTQQSVPEPRSRNDGPAEGDQVAEQQLKRFPYGDGASAAVYLIHKMPPDEFNTMLDLLIKHRDGQLAPSG